MAHRLTADVGRPAELMCVIEHAASALRAGELVVVPTDTVYGLACAVSDENAARRVYELKRRDPRNPLPVLVPWPTSHRQGKKDHPRAGTDPRPAGKIKEVAETDVQGFEELADHFWPGPLTIVLPACRDVAETVVAGGPSVGVRAPDHPVTLQLLEHFGPIAATSANLSGDPPAETVQDLQPDLIGGVSVIIDAGRCPLGEPSTVIDLTLPEPAVLRKGPVGREKIAQLLGRSVRLTERLRED